MLNRFKTEDEGFTLIELLVVILIIGILAAIALPSFLGQKKKGQDANAKSDARNAVSQMESCYADTQDYQKCVSGQAGADIDSSGLSLGTNPGQVNVTSSGVDNYVVTGYSKSGKNFLITKSAGGAPTRTVGGTGSGNW